MLEDFPLEISQRLICLVGSMGTRIVMQEQHAFGEESWSLLLNGLMKFPEDVPCNQKLPPGSNSSPKNYMLLVFRGL
jgi:hypothetical protein